MSKILGLDLGTNSIGWSLIDDIKNNIIASGSRIFPEGVINLGQGKKEESKNASRRMARQTRRQYFRKRIRKTKLLELLIEQKMCPLTKEELRLWKFYDKKKGKAGKQFPSSDKFNKWIQLNPLKLRAEALKKDLSLEEFGRVLYHLIHLRGFYSTRKNKEEGTMATGDKAKGILGYTETKKQFEKHKTYGSFLYDIAPKENEKYKQRELRVRARYTLRQWYIDEFKAIWEKQSRQLKLDRLGRIEKKTTIIGNPYKEGEKKNGIKNRLQKKIDYLKNKGVNIELLIDEKNLSNSKLLIQKTLPLKEVLGGGERVKQEESILFFQRPLRSQKGLLNECTFEKTLRDSNNKILLKENGKPLYAGKKPCPLSHPDAELKRAYEFINNIEFGNGARLSDEQRKIILDLINSRDKNFDFAEIPKALNLTYEKFNYDDKHDVPGNKTWKLLKPLFTDDIWNKNYEKIWHCFYFYSDNDKLYQKLQKDFELISDYEEKILGKLQEDKTRKGGIILKDGYTNLSLKAIRNILPFLTKGYHYSNAVLLGGVRNAFGKRWENFKNQHEEIEKNVIEINRLKENKEGEAIERIKDYLIKNNFGFQLNDTAFFGLYHHSQETNKQELKEELGKPKNLRNPIAQQTIFELKKLISEIKEDYKEHLTDGKHFDQINVEMARELKQSKEKRVEVWQKNQDREKENNEALQRLDEYGLAHTRNNIHKYLLWKELQNEKGIAVCPYTNKTISINDLFGRQNKFQIEHIIPYSRSLDDSLANKTICDSTTNGKKGERTPYQYFTEDFNEKKWEEIRERAFRLLPYNKAKRFTSKDEFKEDDFISRQLNDTRYISKEAKNYLSQICKNVNVFPGQLTAELRHLWGLDEILSPIISVNKNIKLGKAWAVTDKEGKPIAYYPIFNTKPKNERGEFVITGEVKDNEFTSKYLKLSYPAKDCENGKYWATIDIKTIPLDLVKIFIDKPDESQDEIFFLLGNTDKSKKFSSKFLQQKINAEKCIPETLYWAKLLVNTDKTEFVNLKKKEILPELKKGNILLYGVVKDNFFESKIYKCTANIEDGKYYALLNVDLKNIKYYKAKNEKPEPKKNSVVVTGILNDGQFNSFIDRIHPIDVKTKEDGLYWAEFELKNFSENYQIIKNTEPEYDKKNEQLIEGTVTEIEFDLETGEIFDEKTKIFNPAKNRGDHRHHAIDAIIVALTKQGFLQQLSTYTANRKEKFRGNKFNKKDLIFPAPWNKFRDDVEKSINDILVSYKKQNKILITKNTFSKKDGKIFEGVGIRDQLHDKTLYGKRWNDYTKTTFSFRVRKKVTDLTPAMIRNIVDDKIRDIIINKLKKKFKFDTNNKPIIGDSATEKKIFNDILSQQFFLKNTKGGEEIPIRKVRVKVEMKNAEQLKERSIQRLKKKDITDLNQFVEPANNHHILIYSDKSGEIKEDVVSLWKVVERKKNKKERESTVKLPPEVENGSIITTLRINDMFLLGLSEEQFSDKKNDFAFLSKYLYKVEAISSKYYEFRHHLESTQSNSNFPYYLIISSLGDGKKGWKTFSPIKVKLTSTGKLVKLNY